MRATGMLFLSKTRPSVQQAADGTFALQIYAVDRIGAHQVEPWVVLWAGAEAAAWWDAHRAQLVPGAAITVHTTRLRSHIVGRAMPEIHAHAERIELAPPRGHESTPVNHHPQAVSA